MSREFFTLQLGPLERQLPLVSLGPKMRIASFNILGDRELVAYAARQLCRRLRPFTFDYLIGPEITVLPLIHEMAALLAMPRYVVLRKKVHGYGGG
jgi:adenine phosphoribosyltransferase